MAEISIIVPGVPSTPGSTPIGFPDPGTPGGGGSIVSGTVALCQSSDELLAFCFSADEQLA